MSKAPLKSRINIDKRAQSFVMTSDELSVAIKSILWVSRDEYEGKMPSRQIDRKSSRNSINRIRFCGVRTLCRARRHDVAAVFVPFRRSEYTVSWFLPKFPFSGVHFPFFLSERRLSRHTGFPRAFFPQRKLQTKTTFRRCCCFCFLRRFGIDDLVRVNSLRWWTKKIKAALKMRFRSLPKKPASIY